MVFGNGVKNIQAAAYNGARTVYKIFKGGNISREKIFEEILKLLFSNTRMKNL